MNDQIQFNERSVSEQVSDLNERESEKASRKPQTTWEMRLFIIIKIKTFHSFVWKRRPTRKDHSLQWGVLNLLPAKSGRFGQYFLSNCWDIYRFHTKSLLSILSQSLCRPFCYLYVCVLKITLFNASQTLLSFYSVITWKRLQTFQCSLRTVALFCRRIELPTALSPSL